MPLTRILWDELIKDFLKKTPEDVTFNVGQGLILMALQDVDGRIDDLEEWLSEIKKKVESEKMTDKSKVQELIDKGLYYRIDMRSGSKIMKRKPLTKEQVEKLPLKERECWTRIAEQKDTTQKENKHI